MEKLFQLNMLQAYPVDDSWFETFCNAWRSKENGKKCSMFVSIELSGFWVCNFLSVSIQITDQKFGHRK